MEVTLGTIVQFAGALISLLVGIIVWVAKVSLIKQTEALKILKENVQRLSTADQLSTVNFNNWLKQCDATSGTLKKRVDSHGCQIDEIEKITARYGERIQTSEREIERIKSKIYNGHSTN